MKPPFTVIGTPHYEPLRKKLVRARCALLALKVRVGEILTANSETRSRAGECSDWRTV